MSYDCFVLYDRDIIISWSFIGLEAFCAALFYNHRLLFAPYSSVAKTLVAWCIEPCIFPDMRRIKIITENTLSLKFCLCGIETFPILYA
jgi:hypothetical protein